MLTPAEIQQFHRDGYLIVQRLAGPELCAAMSDFTQAALTAGAGPLEYEAEVKYQGAPASLDAPGGHTVRRLLQAYGRAPLFRDWACNPAVVDRLRQLLGPDLVLPQAHHNCIMTKQPGYSSATYWHQDIRHWSYQRPELINAWLALGAETPENGCLSLLPGTHNLPFKPEQLDDALFLRPDCPENAAVLTSPVAALLDPGDVLFFHCRTFHAAGRNETDKSKLSLVFTYRAADNLPVAGSKSASLPEISLS